MKTILVPVDFSNNSDAACRYAINIAKKTKARIILLHAFESSVLYSTIPLVTVQLDYSYLFNAAAKKLKTYFRKIQKNIGGLDVELSVLPGLPSARINELALEKKADLVVMGTTGKGVIERKIIGSNTSRVIRNAPCMVMVVPPKSKFEGLKSIVYATDMTKENLSQAKVLTGIGKTFNSKLVFLNVGSEASNLFTDNEKRFRDKIKEVIKYSKLSGYVTKDTDIPRGIDYFLKYNKSDCLAIFTQHRSLISEIFNKSITTTLSFHTSIPILVLHEHDYIEPVSLSKKKKLAVPVMNSIYK